MSAEPSRIGRTGAMVLTLLFILAAWKLARGRRADSVPAGSQRGTTEGGGRDYWSPAARRRAIPASRQVPAPAIR